MIRDFYCFIRLSKNGDNFPRFIRIERFTGIQDNSEELEKNKNELHCVELNIYRSVHLKRFQKSTVISRK